MRNNMLFLILVLTCFPLVASGQNKTSSVEDTRETGMMTMQNKIYGLQATVGSIREKLTEIDQAIQKLRTTSATHGEDILKALDAVNTTNSNTLEMGETLGEEISRIKKLQKEQAQGYAALQTIQKKRNQELLQSITALDKQSAELLKKNSSDVQKQILGIQKKMENKDQTILKMQKKITLLENSLATQKKLSQEIKDLLSSQREKTLGHYSSLENINATLSGLQKRSQTELKNIHQSITQVVTYGLLSIVGVMLVIVIILLVTRKKTAHVHRSEHKSSAPHASVGEEDDEILKWLKEKE
ncbi:hypothetical protein [Desulfoplanes sp.]